MATEPTAHSWEAKRGFSGTEEAFAPDPRQGGLPAQPDNLRPTAAQPSLYKVLEIAGPPV